MKKIAFTLWLFTLALSFPVYLIAELNRTPVINKTVISTTTATDSLLNGPHDLLPAQTAYLIPVYPDNAYPTFTY